MRKGTANTWVEISSDAISHNLKIFRDLAGDGVELLCVVKANGYGHGMCEVGRLAVEAGATWLGVFSVAEGLALREAGIASKVLVMGPFGASEVKAAKDSNLSLTIGSLDAARLYLDSGGSSGDPPVHLKLETGTNRQGIRFEELEGLSNMFSDGNVLVEGAYTHFADIEDTTDHGLANS